MDTMIANAPTGPICGKCHLEIQPGQDVTFNMVNRPQHANKEDCEG